MYSIWTFYLQTIYAFGYVLHISNKWIELNVYKSISKIEKIYSVD